VGTDRRSWRFRRVVSVNGLDRLISIYPTREVAIAAEAPAAAASLQPAGAEHDGQIPAEVPLRPRANLQAPQARLMTPSSAGIPAPEHVWPSPCAGDAPGISGGKTEVTPYANGGVLDTKASGQPPRASATAPWAL
jgi:hypothetical protein